MSRLVRYGLVVFVLVVLFGAGAYFGSPALLERVVRDALSTDPANDVAIGAIRFNPVTGRGGLRDLRIKTPSGGELAIGLAQFDVDVSALVHRRLYFTELRIDDARLEIDRTAGGWALAGWGPLTGAPSPAAGPRWDAAIDRLEIHRAQLRYRDGDLSQQADIEVFRLSDLVPWRPMSPTTFDLKGGAAGGRVAAKGSLTPFAKALRMTADVRVSALRLEALAPFMALGPSDVLKAGVEADLRGDVRWVGGIEGHVSGTASLADLDAAIGVASAGSRQAHWKGEIKFASASPSKGGAGAGRAGANPEAADEHPALILHHDGTITAESPRLERPYPPDRQRFSAESLALEDLRGDVAIGVDGRLRGTATLNARIKALQSRDRDFDVASQLFEWTGAVAYRDGEDGAATASYDGRASTTGLKLEWLAAGLEIREETTVWTGKLELKRPKAGEPVKLAMEADSQVTGLSIDSKRLRYRVFETASLDLKHARLGADSTLAIDEVAIVDFRAYRPRTAGDDARRADRPALAWKKLTVERLDVPTPARVTARRLIVDGSTARVVRDADGHFDVIGPLLAAGQPAEAGGSSDAGQAPAGTADAPRASFSLGGAVIGGGSRLVFEDRSVEPPVRLAASPFTAEIGAVDSAEPSRDTPFTLSAAFGAYGHMDIKGTLRPFAGRATVEADGTLKSFDLPVISSYVSRNLGYALTRGRMDADIRVGIRDGQLNAGSKLVFSKLQVEAAEVAGAEQLRARLDVPLEKALSLLRDSDDIIRLSLPVTGDIDNPQFDFSDAINQAVGHAIRNALLTTLKFAIPIVGIISILEDAGETKLEFKPVLFAPGSTELDPASLAYLGELGRLLAERRSVTLSVCGRATEADREALAKALAAEQAAGASPPAATQENAPLRAEGPLAPSAPTASAEVSAEQLMRVANRRARLVKDHLVEARGIAHERVFFCASKIDAKTGAAPRVDVLM